MGSERTMRAKAFPVACSSTDPWEANRYYRMFNGKKKVVVVKVRAKRDSQKAP